MAEQCFQCRSGIVELAADDPARQSSYYGYAPAFVLEVLPSRLGGSPGACRATVICWRCMHVLDVDVWFSEEGWDANMPAVLFGDLPIYDHNSDGRDDPETYALGVDR